MPSLAHACVDPDLAAFIDRVIVPALVDRLLRNSARMATPPTPHRPAA